MIYTSSGTTPTASGVCPTAKAIPSEVRSVSVMAAPNTRGDYPRRTAAKFTRTICQQILNGIARKVMISTRNIAGFARWPSLKTVRGVTIVLLLIEMAVPKVAAGTMQHLPCVRAANQLYCPTAGSLYPK